MWTWSQAQGVMSRDGRRVASGYSGCGEGLNNPEAQAAPDSGPIPRGRWDMVSVRDSASTGPFTITLRPVDARQTKGRSDFRIHGDNGHGDHSASHGCIVLPRSVREVMWHSDDHRLTVVRGLVLALDVNVK